MQKLSGKTVLITGATAGIGRACAEQFAALGARLILVARRVDRLQAVVDQLQAQHSVEVLSRVLDVCQREQVEQVLGGLPKQWRDIDILLNNAGLALGLETVQAGNVKDWERMIDTNIKGVLYVTRQVLPGMVTRDRGHVINIGSISGYEVYSGGAVYCATKFALRALSDGIKMDVHGSAIRVSEVDPGMVNTEFSKVRFKDDVERADAVYRGMRHLHAEDIADAVIYCATRAPHVNIRSLKIYPTDQTAAHKVKRDDD